MQTESLPQKSWGPYDGKPCSLTLDDLVTALSLLHGAYEGTGSTHDKHSLQVWTQANTPFFVVFQNDSKNTLVAQLKNEELRIWYCSERPVAQAWPASNFLLLRFV